MNESKWLFTCVFGLRYPSCGEYERDDKSRGAHFGYDGCASCLHREPANVETESADDLWWLDVHVMAVEPSEAATRP